jgi:orotidine-5'-phosphate decarboxylase
MSYDKRLIIALDFADARQARSLVDELGEKVLYYKVGMELYYAAGSEIVNFLKARGKRVFLDLKLQDIPNTVEGALTVLTRVVEDMLNVHATGGAKMLTAAAQAVRQEAKRLGRTAPKLIAVTVLTSMDEAQFAGLNYKNTIAAQVLALAKLAQQAGLDGVVASPQEAAAIRAACGQDFLIVTPGVRPQDAELNDQSRVATPAGALQNGATHLVIGRPVTQAAAKIAALEKIIAEMRDLK